jgi:pyrroline-5-carboxylate reductase
VVGPLDEHLIDVVTAISGSGPAYVFLLAEALAAAGMRNGLDESTARVLARATVSGAGALLESGEDPAALRRAVTSPGGTTAAALSILMGAGGLEALMEAAVSAAIARSRELASS